MFVRLNVVGLFNLLGVLTVIEVELPAASLAATWPYYTTSQFEGFADLCPRKIKGQPNCSSKCANKLTLSRYS